MDGTPQTTTAEATKGLHCPHCSSHRFKVIYTRPKQRRIMRRKKCLGCGMYVVTRETFVWDRWEPNLAVSANAESRTTYVTPFGGRPLERQTSI